MHIERIPEEEFFQGLNERIAELAGAVAETAEKIRANPDSSTYHIDNFFHPLKVMRQLQRIRDKARAFKENENEDVVYVKKTAEDEDAKYYYLPQSRYDRSRLAAIIQQMEEKQDTGDDLGYIS